MAVGKKITDLTASGSLKDTDLAIVHDGNGTKKSALTQLSNYMGTKFSNPNLLINPDFKINQRGSTSYDGVSNTLYTVDRWLVANGHATVSDNGFTVSSDSGAGTWLTQKLEKALETVVTLTVNISNISGKISLTTPSNNFFVTSPGISSITLDRLEEFNIYVYENSSVTLKWAKLEQGSIATPFVVPNPAEELSKCKRYFIRLGTISFIPVKNQISEIARENKTSYFQSINGFFGVQMRKSPTISYDKTPKYTSGEDISGVTVDLNASDVRVGSLKATPDISNWSLNVENVIIDAEIY